MAKSKIEKLYVGAIDFGTTYSGYAFSKKSDYDRDPLTIYAPTWNLSSHVSLKTSTCVLFDSNKKFHSFGFEAEDKFMSLTEEEEHHEWYFFRRFKMMLYSDEAISRDTKIKDEQGNAMVALDVFAASIRYLKTHMYEKCKKGDLNLKESDIQWVLTVPAIWNDKAKSFMREAAREAGIKDDQLILALEPEVASIYCQHQPVERKAGKNTIDTFAPGSKYLVLDAGGGTIDITVHEVTKGKKIKEIYKANGGDWGGTKVDEAFRELLEDIVGKQVVDTFATQYRSDFIELFRNFEIKKLGISTTSDDRIAFKIPIALAETYTANSPGKEVQTAVYSNKKYSNLISWKGDKMIVNAEVAKALFKSSVIKVVDHIRGLFMNKLVRHIQCIVMVGGFSECPMLQEAVKAAFENIKVIVPNEAGLAVLKGAVIFGHNQSIVKARICRYTYGISCATLFRDTVHPIEKKFRTKDGRYYCKDIFLKFIDEGSQIAVEQSLPPKELMPIEKDQVAFDTELISAENKDAKYITDVGCKILGRLVIEIPDVSRGFDRAVLYTMTFGDTELKVKAKDRDSDREVEASFEFI